MTDFHFLTVPFLSYFSEAFSHLSFSTVVNSPFTLDDRFLASSFVDLSLNTPFPDDGKGNSYVVKFRPICLLSA